MEDFKNNFYQIVQKNSLNFEKKYYVIKDIYFELKQIFDFYYCKNSNFNSNKDNIMQIKILENRDIEIKISSKDNKQIHTACKNIINNR